MQNRQVEKYGVIAGALIVIAIILGFWFRSSIGIARGAEEYPISWFIILAAILGSVVNQPFRRDTSKQFAFGWALGYFFWKCSVSVVFAFVLYMMFAAELISGDMFPRFVKNTMKNGGAYVSMKEFATQMKPESYKDVAKILVWSFIAGYSERFVPNLISQILKPSEDSRTRNNSI